MNIAIIYSTKTGHTKKIAEAMAKELGIEAKNVVDKPDLSNVDLLFIGSGIYKGKVSPAMTSFALEIDSSKLKKAIIFTTSCSPNCQTAEFRDILVRRGLVVGKDEFQCKGKFLFFAAKHPDEQDAINAAAFAKKMATE